jgi:hypothetical protein
MATGGHLGVGNDSVYNKTRCFDTFPFPDAAEPQKAHIRHLAEALDAHRKSRQALHPGLTMTGMYNVLEQLRRGEPLGPKDRLIHEQGLVSVLRQLHDELDAAVLTAYGWEDLIPQLLGSGPCGSGAALGTGRLPEALLEDVASRRGGAPTGEPGVEETILQRLVALNAERAGEERRGLVRWLRPDFQNPGGAGTVQAEADLATVTPTAAGPSPAWPKTLPEQIQALRAALSALQGPAGPGDLAQCFTRAPRAKVTELLETLAGLGLVRRLDAGRYLLG